MNLLNTITALLLSFAQALMAWLNLPGPLMNRTIDLDKFTLTWSDEFDGDRLDRAKWSLRAWGAYPQPRCDGYWCYETAKVEDGKLHIASVYAEDGIAGGPAGYYTTGLHTSGLFDQKFGYFEARCQLPEGYGLWSAFWLQSENVSNEDGSGRDGTEIDIYESFYSKQCWPKRDSVSSNLHWDGYGDAHRAAPVGWWHVKKPYDTFHTYGLEWNENEYIFYIDGRESGRSTAGGVCQTELFLILSVEHVFQSWLKEDIRRNKPGEMTDFVVDYVRVYQYKNSV